jgi:hypothetical protein
MGVQHLHFLKLAPTLISVKCSKPHGDWRFLFFSNFISPKFRVHLDLHICHWDFLFYRKIEITKNSSRFASIMEFFCILLQCRVHLSISKLHSSNFLHHGWSKSAVPAGHKQKKLFFPLQTL